MRPVAGQAPSRPRARHDLGGVNGRTRQACEGRGEAGGEMAEGGRAAVGVERVMRVFWGRAVMKWWGWRRAPPKWLDLSAEARADWLWEL
jgi:hypothetical protein